MKSNPVQYDNLSKVFHWVTAIVVVIAFVLGPGDFGRLVNGGVDPATRLDIVWHESLGVAVFVLTLARLLWLAGRPGVPRHPMPAWMAGVSRFVHWVLWGLLISLPLSAAMALGSESHPLTLLGGLPMGKPASSGALNRLLWGGTKARTCDGLQTLTSVRGSWKRMVSASHSHHGSVMRTASSSRRTGFLIDTKKFDRSHLRYLAGSFQFWVIDRMSCSSRLAAYSVPRPGMHALLAASKLL
ncbi:MAG: cytochrome b/b6 domain-containing protein [Ramlibacter sp.]|nr:cytochrome b/b6 domain-containing protein [Ramlibacter sp.]